MDDSEKSLAAADGYYSQGKSEWAQTAMRLTYALADAAVALAPVAILATAPASATLFTVVTTVAVAKSWYEARTGKSFWNGSSLSIANQQLAYVDVALSLIPAAAEIGIAGAKALTQGFKALKPIFTQGAVDARAAEEIASEAGRLVNSLEGTDLSLSSVKTAYESIKNPIEVMGSKTFNDILATPRGSRPLPETYLPKEYIDTHLSKFDEGASRFMPKTTFDKYGPAQSDGTSFVMPKSEGDAMLLAANGDKRLIEKSLGLGEGFLDNHEIIRIDVPKPRALDLRIPSGNEAGASDFWLPGGKLPLGNSEAVLNLGNASQSTWTSNVIIF